MPGKIKVKVLAGRNLPVMDRAGDTTDAFVEIKFGSVTHKTDVCRKSLNPQWNSTEWYRFEVDESELQDEPLQLRLMDHDTYSANDAIGKVVISLAPLLAREAAKSEKSAGPHNVAVMSGWIPVFDTMHGIRGELNVIVKVELFSDFNKYKTSSIGVQFFHCPMIPPGYKASAIHGFVEELVVNDDPEYQWIDKIRTPRASNEARQVAFIKLSNQVQRLVGLKAAELGANAVVGYQQDFDLEGEAGVVARAIGTAVSIEPLPTPSLPQTVPPCSQQQLKKYLDILATGDETVTDLNQYFQNHQDELGRLLNILHPKLSSNFLDETENNEEDDKSMGLTRQSSIKSYTDSVSIYQDDFVTQSLRTISEDQTELNRLLNRKDDEDSDSSGPFSKIKKIKQNFFSKRLPSIRSKRGDKKQDINEDTLSIKSNSSDTSRLSINDIKYEFKKLKRLKTAKFQKQYKNDDDEGVGMASILARSVIHARTSLACIAESIDSETSPNATIRRSSESEPAINVTDDVKEKIQLETIIDEEDTKVSDRRYASLKNVNTESEAPPARQRKISGSCPNSPVAARSDNHLKLPGETSYFGSVSSAMSGESSEMYSSSDADDESSDMKTDTEKSYETTASVVQTVLRQSTSPSLIAQIDKKLSVLDCVTPEPKDNEDDTDSSKSEEEKIPEVDNNKNEQLEERSNKSRDPSSSEQFVKPTLNFKFLNPFCHKKSVSAPSSPVEKVSIVDRSSEKIKRQLSKISNSSMIKSISHMSLIPKKKEKPMSQPTSSSDIASNAHSHETVLGSQFLSYSDLLSLDKESDNKIVFKDDHSQGPKVQMYIGSEPASRASVSMPTSPYSIIEDPIDHKHRKEKCTVKPTGLIHTAMETILIDKVQSLLIPATPEVTSEQKFFDDVNQKLEQVEESRKPILQRQDSIHSVDTPRKMSNESNIVLPKVSSHAPMLQHFHPIMSPKLETIPSLPESSLDKLDVESGSETNSSVVYKHAACSEPSGRSERSSPRHSRHESYGGREPAPTKNESFNASSTPVGMHRRSSDSDLSITPKGSILNSSLGNPGGAILRPSMNTNNLEMLEYPFLTMTEFPPGFIVHIGGMVCARSVKLVGAGGEESARAAAWAELRTEMRAHARALRCAAVLAYREAAAICEEVCVLSASGTAAVINLDCDYTADPDGYVNSHSLTKSTIEEDETCCTAHVPYSPDTGPYKAELQHCASCRRARVPAVLLATCAKPSKLATYGKTVPLTACAARARRGLAAEAGARELSDQLPFLEYELHKLLLAKLRMQGANALFNLHTQISVGERCVVALACGAACRLAALPDSHPPTVKASENDKDAVELQRALWDTFTANKIANGYDVGPPETAPPASPARPAPPELDLGADKDTCVLELDETEDVETARLLATRRANMELFTNGLRAAPAAPPQAFAQVWRARFSPGGAGGAERHVSRALRGAQYKLRRLRPVALALAPCALQLATPDDEIQLVISGTAIPLETRGAGDTEEGIFALDEENEVNANNVQAVSRVILTSLSQVAGSRCSRRVCALRSLFVRETTAVRELGGLSGFLHTFTSEVLAIVRAYTAALGGNALTSFYITQLMLQDNAHKNQGQCLMSVGGDVVHITY